MPTLTEWLDDIEAKAKAATGGPWRGPMLTGPDDSTVWSDGAGWVAYVGNVSGRPGTDPEAVRLDANGRHIARCDPPTVERLVRLCRALLTEREEYPWIEGYEEGAPCDAVLAAIESELGGDNG